MYYIYVYIFIRGSYVYADMICESTYRDIYILHMYIQDNQSPFNLTAHIDFSTYRTPGSPFDICIPGSSWSWKFRHQSQKLSILPNSREKELMNGYFHSRTLFFASERFRAVLKVFTFFYAFGTQFCHSRTSKVSRTAKTTPVFFFPHPSPQLIFFWFGVKNSSIGKLQVL